MINFPLFKMLPLLTISILLSLYPSAKSIKTHPSSNSSQDNAIQNFSKCFCGPEQVWNGLHCIDIQEDVVMSLLGRLRLQPLDIVDASGSPCFTDEKQIAVIEGAFYFTEYSKLYHKDSDMIFSTDQFCLEYYGSENGEITIHALLCVPPPKALVCSQRQLDWNSTINSVPVLFGGSALQWDSFDVIQTTEVTCDEKETKERFNLVVNESVSLRLVDGEVRPLWVSSPPNTEYNLFPISNYCFYEDAWISNNNSLSGEFCYYDAAVQHNKLCSTSTCVRKCCQFGQTYHLEHRRCVDGNETYLWKAKFHNAQTKRPTGAPKNLVTEYDFPLCNPQDRFILDPKVNPADDFLLLDNGLLHVALSNTLRPSSKYCIDNFIDSNGDYSVKAISCFLGESEYEDSCKEMVLQLSSGFIIVSCLFLAITLTVYGTVPELRAKLHGKSLLSHVTSLLVAYLCQVILRWNSKSLTMTGCKLIALCNQVSFLWAFFWLNVMCFDIWWTLKSMSPSPESGEDSRRRFALYSVYAWGCPLIIMLITAVMEFLPSSAVDKYNLILPGFGIRGCWFQDQKSTWLYFHGFTLILYVLNLLFFIHVAAILIIGQRSTRGILRTTKKQQRERVFLYLRLFAVMGITWICEVASWQEGTCKYWIFTDVVNSCQGVFLFFIFMCNKKVLKKMKARWIPVLRRLKEFARTPSPAIPVGGSSAAESNRTTQTSVESTSRRLSTSSLQQLQSDTSPTPLNETNRKEPPLI